MNLYCSIDTLKTEVSVTGSTYDALLRRYIGLASRRIDALCGRRFYAETGTRYFGTQRAQDDASGVGEFLGPREGCVRLAIDDCLSLTEVKADADGDGTFSETWAASTDYNLEPANTYPKTSLRAAVAGNYTLCPNTDRYIKATGLWGYGDTATPYEASGVNVTVATTNGTTITLSANGVIEAGHTILVGSEQMYVVSVGTLSAVVQRAVNGTTATTHTAAASYIWQYPDGIVQATIVIAAGRWNLRGRDGLSGETMGDYTWRAGKGGLDDSDALRNLASHYTKVQFP